MNRVGGGWLVPQNLSDDEENVWSCLANRTQGACRSVGGKLYLTTQRVLFCPHWLDYAFRARPFAARYEEILSVGREHPGDDILGGGLRSRIRIEMRNGPTELFLVNRLDHILKLLENSITGHE